MSLVPKSWSTFQHYKNRNPPWVKLHKTLLDDRDFFCLPVASKALAPMLWLLASEGEDGIIEKDLGDIAFRLRMTEADLTDALKPLVDKGFFIDASGMLAERQRVAIPETEKETEKEKRQTQSQKPKKMSAAGMILNDPDLLDKFQTAYQSHPRRRNTDGTLRPAGNQAKGVAVVLNRIAEGVTWNEVLAVEQEYRNHPNARDGFAQNFEVFWGDNGHWFQSLAIVRSKNAS